MKHFSLKSKIIISFFIIFLPITSYFIEQKIFQNYKNISFTTEDGVIISANFYPRINNSTDKAIILLHMNPSTKESWNDLSTELSKKGYDVLSIDLRGHGNSTLQNKNTLNYQNFSDEDYLNHLKDIDSSINYLILQKDYKERNIILGGASIGANLSIISLINHPNINKVFAISPGLKYKSLDLYNYLDLIPSYKDILLISTLDDIYSYNSSKSIIEKYPFIKSIFYKIGGHGTNILNNNSEIKEDIINFLNN